MGLLLDKMLSGAIAEQLRARNVDCVAVVDDAQLIGSTDEDLLAQAADRHRVLVTAHIADFAAIATDWRAGREHSGLVYVTNRAFPHDRSFVGAVVSSLSALHDSESLARPGAETFLRRI